MPEIITFNPTLTNISLQYRGEELIWREVLPPIKVGSRAPQIRKYNKDDRFRIPNDVVGPRSQTNEADFGVSLVPIAVVDHGLQEPVSVIEADEAAAEGVLSLEADATEFVTWLLEVAQEQRVANLVFAAGTYPAGNKVTLSGTAQWNDEAVSKPLTDILTGLDAAFIRPTVAVFNSDSYRNLRKHPQILDAIKGRTGIAPRGGLATSPELADLFELKKVLVGRERINTAKEGQAAVYTRLWGKHCALLHQAAAPTRMSIAFGFTFAETLLGKAFTFFDANRGPKGSNVVRVIWNSQEQVTASDLGYFIENAVA